MSLLKKPNKIDLEKSIVAFEENETVNINDVVLNKLFKSIHPQNTKFDEVIVKVATLDSLYNTQLSKYRAAVPVANHIIGIADIDKRLQSGDVSVVDEIAQNRLPDGRDYRCYSFATKYCSFHNPDAYPIYDSYVDKVLKLFNKEDNYIEGRINNKKYHQYAECIRAFRKFYKLEDYSLKQLDKYLWQLGDELKNTKDSL